MILSYCTHLRKQSRVIIIVGGVTVFIVTCNNYTVLLFMKYAYYAYYLCLYNM